ncbi:hypothetical protein ONZ45_g12970 [Pleurotus djamor]|nr:hypothetical protein ONZ45_g12970 [Pleurotus djamor]
MPSTAPALFKLTFLVINVIAGFLASRDPGKFHPPTSSERLKIGTIILPLCEVITILTLFTGPDSVYYKVVTALLPFSKISNAYRLSINPAFVMLSSISITGAALLRRHCFIVLGRYFTYDLSIREGHKLITTCPYSIVRHPSYTCFLMIWFATPGSQLVRGSWLTEFMCVAIYPWAYARMDKEDKMLRKKFGREWDMWREAVPYWLIPGVY